MDDRLRRPAARVSAARDMLDACEAFEAGARDAIRSTFPAESLLVLDGSSAISWLEYEHDRWVMDGAVAHFGRERALRCFRSGLVRMTRRPLLRSFVEPALRLFAGRPGGLVAMLPRGWGLAYRDFCTPSFDRLGAGAARVLFDDIAPEAFVSDGYLLCWYGICQGTLDLEHLPESRVEFEVDRSAARAVATFSWAE